MKNRTSVSVVVLALCILLALGGYALFNKNQDSGAIPAFSGPVFSARPPSHIPEGFVEYRHEHFGFSFFHSPDMRVREFSEGGGASTIVAEDVKGGREFQIFIVPYAEKTISGDRFRRDVPSGVRENEVAVMVDGTPAVAFHSTDASVGNTREIWFIRNGFLYEVTTLREFEDWLTPILDSFTFEKN